ncbi:MAG TPA: GTPase HflX [Nitrososphaera sp.]|nr:GTPase HflX [Nitrososphaera sp.]
MKPIEVVLVTYPDSFTLQEAKSLAESMTGWSVVKIFTQKYLNHAEYGVGSGKAHEIKEFLRQSPNVRYVIVDEQLTSKKLFNLEKLLGIKVIDRERLILDIFYTRATTNEAKLQIQLAEIKYEMPRVREIAKISAGNERPGKGGSGEYEVDVKFRDLKRRMSFIKEKLAEAKSKRDLYHQQRKKAGMPIISLVGYTSAGKTTLFNLLTSEHKETSDSLFTTLSTTTRSMKVDERTTVLLIDTVGFVSRLPTYMIDAFKSTLEESLTADLILLLIDSFEALQDIRIKYSSCWQVLEELKVDRAKVLAVLTKYDNSTDAQKIDEIIKELQLENPLVVSSNTGYGVHKLKTIIKQRSIPRE